MWETEGSYYEHDDDYYTDDETQFQNASQWDDAKWNSWFEIDVVHEDGNSVDYNFMEWSVGGEDMVWMEPVSNYGTFLCFFDKSNFTFRIERV